MMSQIVRKDNELSVKTKIWGPSERLMMEREHSGGSYQSSEKGVTL
jgi:hypothetical protein